MANITFGNGYDDSRSSVTVDTYGSSDLNVQLGERHQHAAQSVKIHDTPVETSRSSRAIAVAATIVIGSVILIATFAVVARAVSPVALPIVIGAALLCTYLVALVVAPKENASGLARFDKLLLAFFKLLGGRN